MDALQLTGRAAGIVSGDTLQERKPHPAPLLHACALIGTEPDRCLYVGDAERDIQAGRNAGMATLVALFGYLTDADRPETWGATALIETPEEILGWLP
jgi:phosphoglycolate phosphatase